MASTPTLASDDCRRIPHVALIPSAGMGHLTPFTRLAAALVAHGCEVSFLVARPTVSSAEARAVSDLLAAFPQVRLIDFHVDPLADPSADPFFLRWEAISRSAHLLAPLLAASSPPLTALVADMTLASACLPVAAGIRLPCYILFTTSAAMLALCAHFPVSNAAEGHAAKHADVEIPGLPAIPSASVPPMLRDPAHLFTTRFVACGRALCGADGILVNTFEALELETIAALNSGSVVSGLPPVIPVGPLRPVEQDVDSTLRWLDAQPVRSVVYVSFGSRTAMSRDQVEQLAAGLETSGYRFLWAIKSKKVDREEAAEAAEMLKDGFLERVRGRGVVVSGWAEQAAVLRHGAVGGFVSHCGWNSVTEAALSGVRVLAWPRIGDQRVNAAVVQRSGLGIWAEEWGWEAEGEEVVGGEAIRERVCELMESPGLCASAARVAEAAAAAIAVGGSSDKGLEEFILKLQR